MSFLSNILALLPDNISKRIKPVDLRNSFEYVYADMAKLQEDRILTLGSITATTTTIDLAVHSSGVNSVQLDGEVLSKNTANHWDFAEVTDEEVFQIYATNSAEIFHLALDGDELPEGALIVATIAISETGISIDEAVSGFREKAIDKWANLMTAGGDIVLSLHHNQMRYRVSSSANDVRIGGFKNYVTDLLYSGIPLSIKNNTEGDIEFFNAVDASPFFIPIYSADLPFKIKKGETANFAWNTDNGFEIVKTGGGGGASFPELGSNGDVLVKNSASADGAVWSNRLTNVETNKQDKSLFSALLDKWIHYYDSATAKMQPIIKLVTGAINQLEFDGRMKIAALILPPNTNPNVANRLWSDGTYVYYDNGLAIPKRLGWSQSNVFTYTPTGNFTLSAIKTAMENAGYVFNDAHIIVNLGSNNFTFLIDIGASNPSNLFTITRTGTGSISFSSTRTLNAGVDNITIMNGNENSMALVQMRANTDFLTVRNK